MNKPPAFQFYPQDFLSSLKVQVMTSEEIGGYCLLLFNSWIQPEVCYLPNDSNILKKICRMSDEQWERSKKAILTNFQEKDEKIYNKKLLGIYKAMLKRRKSLSDRGKQGGRPKKLQESYRLTDGKLNESQVKAEESSSSSTSSSTSSSKKKKNIYPPDFNLFWKPYPRKTEKDEALKVWKKKIAAGFSPQELELASKNYAKFKKNSEKSYIKYPARFLIKESIEDWQKDQGIDSNGDKPKIQRTGSRDYVAPKGSKFENYHGDIKNVD